MAKSAEIISHWHHHVEDFNTSSLEFYAAVRAELEEMQAPVKFDTVEWAEGGITSAKRTYLRVEHNRLTFDVCAAPFGKSFFFSWWLSKRAPDLVALYGCLTLIALPIVFALAVSTVGFFKGVILFLLLLGVAWWILSRMIGSGAPLLEDTLMAMSFVGPFYVMFFRPVTYYAVDSRIMFEQSVHETVLKVIEGLLAAKGARVLTAEQRKATSKDALR